MNTLAIQPRLAPLVLIFGLILDSSVVAQGHKSRNQGNALRPNSRPIPHVADQAKTPPKTSTPQPQAGQAPVAGTHPPAPAIGDLIASLHATRTHLAQAEPDSQGHRDRAILEIDAAIKLLNLPDRPAPRSESSPPDSTSGPKPPALPETHWGQARQSLRDAESRMSAEGINSHRFIKARGSVQTAIRELNLALVDR